MSQFWQTSAITGVGLFLETCAFYLAIVVASVAIHLPDAALPVWLVFLALLWAFLLSGWVQSLPASRSLRGVTGLAASVLSLLILSYLHLGPGPGSLGGLVDGDGRAAVMLAFSSVFLLLLWWRGATIAYEEITLDTVRGSFRWGLMALFVAVLADSFTTENIVSGYLVVSFFAVGLVGLSLARFSWEAGDSQVMSANWWVPIGASVGAVILLALIIGALGMGGLDDFTRTTLRSIGNVGLWVLTPVLLALGFVASLLVGLANLVSGWFGGGDLTGLELAQQQLNEFHQQLEQARGEGGLPPVLLWLLKGTALVAAIGAAGWVLYRVFRFRRLLRRAREVEETRESLFSWSRANRDLSVLLSGWWNSLSSVGGLRARPVSEPANPREFYHRLLQVAEELGRPRWEWETPKQHQGALLGMLPREPLGRIVDTFQLTYYGQAEITEGELARLRQDWAVINEFVAEQGRRG